METQIWSQKPSEKWAYFLTLRGTQIHKLKVTGSQFTIKKNIKKFLEALSAGQLPSDAGAKVVGEIDAPNIAQAELSPDNGTLTLKADGPGAASFNFSPDDDRADLVWDVVRARTGRDFQPTPTGISSGEAITPPIVTGLIAGVLWGLVYYSATQVAAGEEIEIKGRRRGLQQLFATLGETLGTTGSIAVGVVLLVLVLGWALRRLMVRPIKTLWMPHAA